MTTIFEQLIDHLIDIKDLCYILFAIDTQISTSDYKIDVKNVGFV